MKSLNTKKKSLWTVCCCFYVLTSLSIGIANSKAATITTVTIKEMDGVSTSSYPLTFGHVFQEGDVTGSVYLDSYATQTDVKTTWPDGSIRQAVISAIVPMTANADLTLNINDTGTSVSSTPMTKSAMLATDIGATIDLTSLSGSGYSGSLKADLRTAINAASSFDYWLEGGIASEILIQESLNASLDASWEVRFYPSTPYIRISHSIENMKISTRGNVDYAVEIKQGNSSPVSVYSKDSFQHNHSSRWRKVFWLGTEPPEVEIHYDLNYMVGTGMVMPYDALVAPTEADIADHYALWSSADTDIMGRGLFSYNFGATGGRPELGILPQWGAMYLLTMDNRMREMVIGHDELSGGTPSHIEEDDAAYSFYGKTINIDDFPYSTTGGSVNTPTAIGSEETPWNIDRAHQAAFGYLSYLITGERFFLDEMYYWAGKNLAWDSYGRDGDGNAQEFSAQIGDGNAANGIMYNQVRGVAWSLRNIHNAAICSPIGSDERNYFLSKVENNIKWLYLGNTGGNAHGLNAFRGPREDSPLGDFYSEIAPWMHDFVILSLSDIIRKDTVSNMTELTATRDIIGLFTIGRFSNDPAFPKFEGAGYHWPLRGTTGGYYSDGDWGNYWQDVMIYPDSAVDPNNIKTDFTRDYADGYPAIARAALSQLIHLTDGETAYNFVMSNINYKTWSPADPTWAIVPVPKIISIKTEEW